MDIRSCRWDATRSKQTKSRKMSIKKRLRRVRSLFYVSRECVKGTVLLTHFHHLVMCQKNRPFDTLFHDVQYGGDDFVDAHAGGVQFDGVIGFAERVELPGHVVVVALLDVFQNFFVGL